MPNDIIRLSGFHSLMQPNLAPELAPKIMEGDHHKAFEAKLGLFESAAPNFNTFYPEVKAEDLVAKDDEFVYPVFRLLSAGIIHRGYDAIDFSAEILKAAKTKLKGQTVYPNHEMLIGNEIGSVSDVFWDEGYSEKGVNVPAGINGQFKIDAKSHPKIARGLTMNPPSIHSNSVTVNFDWEPSHKYDTPGEFIDALGSKHKDGKMVRRVVTKINAFFETSLVPHGADPFAQKVGEDGKIINPKLAASRSVKFTADEWKTGDERSYSVDFADQGTWTTSFASSDEGDRTTPSGKDNNLLDNSEDNKLMKDNFIALALLLGITLDSEKLTDENAEAEFKAALEKFNTDNQAKLTAVDAELTAEKAKVTTLTAEKDSLGKDITALKAHETFHTDQLAAKREAVKELYTKALNGEPATAVILSTIENADFKTLEGFETDYTKQVEKLFPGVCGDCNSHNVTRASAAVTESAKPKKDITASDYTSNSSIVNFGDNN